MSEYPQETESPCRPHRTAPWYGQARVSRRRLLAGSLALGGAWTPLGRATAALADDGCPAPPDFPAGIDVFRRAYRNWAGEIAVDDVWTCVPATAQDVVMLADWAHRHDYTLRAQGFRHGWSPLTIPAGDGCPPRTVLVDTTEHLTGVTITGGPVPTARVLAGTAMETLLTRLEEAGYGLTATPAPGDLSVAGALAIGAHGTAVPATGETRAPGTTYGSLSNLVLALTAVVWDGEAGGYALRTIRRSDPDSAALLTHLGRAFVTEVTLRVGANSNLRCVSRVDIPADELFAAPAAGGTAAPAAAAPAASAAPAAAADVAASRAGSGGRSLASFLDSAGRVEAIWFAFTEFPWLKVWSVEPTRPLASRPVTGPYNYPFSDNVPEPVAVLVGRIAAGEYFLAPLLGQAQYDATAVGLTTTASVDIWGPSKNVLLYVRPTTLRVHANGYAVLTSRGDAQRVVHEFTTYYRRLLNEYAARGSFPVNGAVEIRVTGLDDPGHVAGSPGATGGVTAPALSAVAPAPDRPGWDCAVWLDVLSLPGTQDLAAFFRDLERFIIGTFDGTWARARVEWSKGWAYSEQAAWSDPEMIGRVVPASLPAWDRAVATLDRLDPHRVFSNAFLDGLLR